jgi:hypothetical protein
MPEELNLVLPPHVAFDEAALRRYLEKKSGKNDFTVRISDDQLMHASLI